MSAIRVHLQPAVRQSVRHANRLRAKPTSSQIASSACALLLGVSAEIPHVWDQVAGADAAMALDAVADRPRLHGA